MEGCYKYKSEETIRVDAFNLHRISKYLIKKHNVLSYSKSHYTRKTLLINLYADPIKTIKHVGKYETERELCS